MFKAASGDYRYQPSLKSEYGSPSMIDIKTGKELNYAAYHIPGVGLSDFIKKEKEGIQSTLDRRIHVGQYLENIRF